MLYAKEGPHDSGYFGAIAWNVSLFDVDF